MHAPVPEWTKGTACKAVKPRVRIPPGAQKRSARCSAWNPVRIELLLELEQSLRRSARCSAWNPVWCSACGMLTRAALLAWKSHGAVSSARLERLLDTQEVRGSNPLRPTRDWIAV